MVLADPRFVEPEAIEVLEQLEVTFEGKRRVLAGRVERRHEQAEAHPPHSTLFLTGRSTTAALGTPQPRLPRLRRRTRVRGDGP